MSDLEKALKRLEESRESYFDDLIEVLKIPSISSDPDHETDVRKCAQHIKSRLEAAGMENAQLLETGGHPSVYAEWLHRQGAPTVLLYGHHDVQPVEPLQEWKSPPFEPAVRDGDLYARGSVDDKGQVYVHIHAIESFLATCKNLPLNVKIIVEGEEEIGSPNLEKLLERYGDLLKADLVVISDTPMYQKGIPSICVGLRGLVYLEVTLEGPRDDLHSGMWGGVVENPAQALCQILGGMKDFQGRVSIPHFYDKVLELNDRDRKQMESLPFNSLDVAKTLGLSELSGESGRSPLERIWARPTFEINGLESGHTGPGAKTIIPKLASAKVSMRLVPDQDPLEIVELFKEELARRLPSGVRLRTNYLGGGPPFICDTEHPAYGLAAKALEAVFGSSCVHIREGGSIPMVSTLARASGAPCLLLGFGLPDENAHAPNERLNMDNYWKGTQAMIRLFDLWGRELS